MRHPSLADREFFSPLQGLRGIAILYVVASHLANGGLFLLPIPHDAIGKIGVWIFFVLSAFLLTTHLCSDFETTSSRFSLLLQYAVHRVFRIYPLFIVALIIHLILGDISPVELIKHLSLMQGWAELWAIPVEFQYYLMMPVIAMSALYLPKRTTILLLIFTMTLSLLYGIAQPASVFSNNLNIIPKLTPFLLGSILALLLFKKNFGSPESQVGFVFLIPTVSLLIFIISTVSYRCISKDCLSNLFAPWLTIVIGMSVIGMIYSALQLPTICKLLGTKLLVFLGQISFSIYLLHTTVIHFVHKIPSLSAVTEAWLSLGLSIVCSSVTYWTIERTGINAGKKISQSLRNRFETAPMVESKNDDHC